VPASGVAAVTNAGAWPNFFIVGAPKAGTSSLHAYLQAVPGIFMSKIKEPNYFSRVLVPDDHPLRPIRDTQQYLALFAGATTERVVGEASPTYLADPETPRRIHAVAPGARILISLRDPVERAYSHYLMMRNNGKASGSFLDEARRGLVAPEPQAGMPLRPDVGLYHDAVRRYLDVFGAAQVQVILFEEFMADVAGTLARITRFLGVEHDFAGFRPPAYRPFGEARGPIVRYLFGNRTVARVSEAMIPPGLRRWIRERILVRKAAKPQMDHEARALLCDFYRDDVARVATLLGRPLPWRNFSERADSQPTAAA
jgi:hypothetical protein